MANHKRTRPRTSSGSYGSRRPAHFLNSWPRWWDLIYHTRPKRRITRRLLAAVLIGCDPDGVVWPVGNHKPHKYYW